MATLRAAARLTLTCRNEPCGKKFEQDPAALIKLGRAAHFCADACLIEGAPDLVCASCADVTDPDRPGIYDRLLDGLRLPICQNCQYIAFRSCWRKRCFPSEDVAEAWVEVYWVAGRLRGAGQLTSRLHPYPCLLCERWHTTGNRGRLSNEYRERLLNIAAVFDDLGFRVDELRGWTIHPDGSRGIAGADDLDRHYGVLAAQRVLQQARLDGEL